MGKIMQIERHVICILLSVCYGKFGGIPFYYHGILRALSIEKN